LEKWIYLGCGGVLKGETKARVKDWSGKPGAQRGLATESLTRASGASAWQAAGNAQHLQREK